MKLGSAGILIAGVRESILLLMLQFLFAVHRKCLVLAEDLS